MPHVMHNDSNSTEFDHLFQPGKEKAFAGKNLRLTGDRPELTPELETLKDDIFHFIKREKGNCGSNCLIPEEARGELGHMTGMVKDLGGKEGVSGGIEKIRDHNTFVENTIKMTNSAKSTALKTLTIVLVTYLIGLLTKGFWVSILEKLKEM